MMDEQLIDEVAQHGVIYNRQKYYLNGSGGGGGSVGCGTGKYETKDEAWHIIAMKLHTDVETCKKRWKYLRERYVSQRKQGDPPVYEHLSRPYLEKMKFLDQHIQPRKSYRNVPNFLTSPHSANSSNYSEYNMDSKSNGSMKNMGHFTNNTAAPHQYHQQQDPQHTMNALSTAAAAASALENANGQVKIEADQVFRDFAAAVASQQLQQISQTQMQHHQAAAVAAAIADSSQNYQEHFRENAVPGMSVASGSGVAHNGAAGSSGTGVPSSSSSMKSPLSSPLSGMNGTSAGAGHSSAAPQQAPAPCSSSQHMTPHIYNSAHNDNTDSPGGNYTKKPRVQLNSHTPSVSHTNNNANTHNTHNSNSHFGGDDTDVDSDDNSNMIQPQAILGDHPQNTFNSSLSNTSSAAVMQRNAAGGNNTSNPQQNIFPSNADFLFQLYQQLPHQQQNQSQQHFNKFQAPQPTMQRSSEHLLGELVTTELLKMTKERRKHVQKRILELLFFDD